MPKYKVKTGDTLSAIASRYKVSPDEIQADNPIIQDANHIEEGWNLTVPDNTERQDSFPNAQSANDETRDDVECSECSVECEALVHITGEEDIVYALTCTQVKELRKEIDTLNEPLLDLKEAEKDGPEEIPAARKKAWNRLKELGALPKPEHSSTAEELLREYEAKWQRERARLEHQRHREKRIEYEISQIRNQILFPASQRKLTDPKDKLSVKVFAVLCLELETTLPRVRGRLEAYEEATSSSKKDLNAMEKRLKFLRAALEAEIRCRIAEESGSSSSPETRQFRYEADQLKKHTLWPNYIAENDVQTLVRKQQRLNQLDNDDRLMPYMDYVDDFLASTTVVWVWKLFNHEEVQAHNHIQKERSELLTDIEKSLSHLVETSPASSVDVLAKPNLASMKSRPLVELKHTGGSGYRYARKEVLEQLRGNWRPLKAADVRKVMNSENFERAWGEATDSLKNNRSLKVKFSEWKSKEDNFLNQLEIELLKEEVATEDGRFAASAEAQMFRFAAQCGLEANYDPKKEEAYIGGQMQGTYSLLQGEATFAARLPDETGAKVILEYEDHEGKQIELHCGYFRADAEYRIQGFAGACLSLAAQAKISTAPGEVGISGETSGEVFAGASLSNEASFGIKWKSAYQDVNDPSSFGQDQQRKIRADKVIERQEETDADYRMLAEIKPELAVSSGFGFGFDYKIGLDEGKIIARFKGSLVLGPGGRGGIAGELNAGQIWELVKFIRWSLEKSDFRFLDWIDRGAFEQIELLLKTFVFTKADFTEFFEQGVERIERFWQSLNSPDKDLKDVAVQVIESDDILVLTPGAKADILGRLMKDGSAVLSLEDPYRESADRAAMKIIESIVTHREFVEVLKRMGNAGHKGGFQDLKNNYSRVFVQRLFRSEHAQKAENWLSDLYSSETRLV